MHMKERIDLVAISGKFFVDLSSMEERKKLLWKTCIDAATDVVKALIREPLTVQQIQEAAQQCNLDRVVAIQCIVDSKEVVLFNVTGGDTTAFYRCIGVQMLPEDAAPMLLSDISGIEEQYGIVLYERRR